MYHLVFFIVLMLSSTSLSFEVLNLEEGAKCVSNQIPGECVSAYKCLSSYIDILNQDFTPICSLKGDEPIICCTDCNRNNNTRRWLVDPRHVNGRIGKIAEQKCVAYMYTAQYHCKTIRRSGYTRRYIPEDDCNLVDIDDEDYEDEDYDDNIEGLGASGGADTMRDEYPHMALLGYGTDIKKASWHCGGTVISEKFILTAGHCISNVAGKPVSYAALGILKRSDPKDKWQIYNISKIIPHPEYKSPMKYNDIALLETATKIIFNKNVKPACLHTNEEVGPTLTATGWGHMGSNLPLADTLQAVNVTLYEPEECAASYPRHRLLKQGYNDTTQMCYGDKSGIQDTCGGDSGGPLQVYDNLLCAYAIVGVTSFGRTCGSSPSVSIYTRVNHYVPWIESIVWP